MAEDGKDWIKVSEENNSTINVASLVTAAALETCAMTDYEYLPDLDLYYETTTGYFFKQGFSDFYHAESQYCCHFSYETGQYEWILDYDWPAKHNCPFDLNVYLLVKDLVQRIDDLEPGEIIDSPASSSKEFNEIDEIRRAEDEIEPCIRMILQSSNNNKLNFGELFIVTIQGAVIGTNSKCDIQIFEDCSVKENHCKISFDSISKSYSLIHLTEDENVYVNETLLDKNEHILKHKDSVIIGNTHFSLHIHKGTNTCADCEPGLQIISQVTSNLDSLLKPLTKNQKEKLRKRELKAMKSKYGLGASSRPDVAEEGKKNYVDRAEIRRKTVGSDNNFDDCRPIETASVMKPMSSTNKGYKLLAKMGWKEGESLGIRDDGIKEPVCPMSHVGFGGLGSDTSSKVQVGDQQEFHQKRFKWLKTKERFVKLPNTFDNLTEDVIDE